MTRLRRRRDVNRPTFSAVAEDCLDEVYRYLLVLTADPALADDLTGATFEKALGLAALRPTPRGAGRLAVCDRPEHRARPLPRREAAEAARGAVRGRPAGVGQTMLGLSPELEAAMAKLTAADREVLALRVVLELDAEAAARVLGVSRTACSMRLARALTKLEERMAADALA